MLHKFMVWTSDNVLAGLYIAVAILLLIVLYHLLFIVVDLRKILRSVRHLTEQLEAVILKPLSMTDKAIEWIAHHLEHGGKHHKKHE